MACALLTGAAYLRADARTEDPAARVYAASVAWAEAYARGDLEAALDAYLVDALPAGLPRRPPVGEDHPFHVSAVEREGADWVGLVAFAGYPQVIPLRWSLAADGTLRLR